MQGFLFAKPTAAADIDRLIEAQRSSAHVAPTPLRADSRG
jgi:hypothetical protein